MGILGPALLLLNQTAQTVGKNWDLKVAWSLPPAEGAVTGSGSGAERGRLTQRT